MNCHLSLQSHLKANNFWQEISVVFKFTRSCPHNLIIFSLNIFPIPRLDLFPKFLCFDVLLTVQLGIFILVINQLDAQNFCFK